MVTITAADVKKLRDATNLGMMDCKNALVETEGDFEKAVLVLREKNKNIDLKKGGREAREGAIGIYVNEDSTVGAIVEVNCETDFVARNEAFRELVADLAYQAALSAPANIEEFLAADFIRDEGKSVKAKVTESISTLGENVVVGRIETVAAPEGVLGAYVHSDGKKAAIVVAQGKGGEAAAAAAREIAMQAVALRAPYLNRDSVPSAVIEGEKEFYRKQAAEEGKPAEMQEKIATGRLNKYFKDATLLEQAFIKDDKKTVQQVAKDAGFVVTKFVRFEIGQAS
jgi:elongation factor Ts